MHKGKYVFSQLLDFLDKDVFLWSPLYLDNSSKIRFHSG